MSEMQSWATNLTQDDEGIWIVKNDTHSTGSTSPDQKMTIFYPPMGNELFNSLEDDSFWFRYRNQVITSMLQLYPPPSTPFLEIGAGNGYVSSALNRNGIPVISVEPNRTGARNTLKRGLTNVICAPFEDVMFQKASFGCAGIFDVLEHIPQPVQFLKRIRNFLNRNGHLYITVPAYQFLYSPWDKQVGHFRRYSIPLLQKQLIEAEFTIKFQTHFMSTLLLPVFLFRTLPGIFHKKSSFWKSNSTWTHLKSDTLSGSIADKFQSFELPLLKKGVSIPFGTSCMVIACAE